jgi:hypothetical protein
MRVIKSRSSSGVIGMDLEKGDNVVSITIINGAEKDIAVREEYLNIPLELRILIKTLDNKELEEKISSLERKINLDIQTIRKWHGNTHVTRQLQWLSFFYDYLKSGYRRNDEKNDSRSKRSSCGS